MTIRGIAFPFRASSFSLPATATDADVVEDNIRRIIQTPLRSRVMRPATGSTIYAFVFENGGPLLQARIDNEIRRAIGEGEPRARVLAVETLEQETAEGGTEILVGVTWEFSGIVRTSTVTFTPPPTSP